MRATHFQMGIDKSVVQSESKFRFKELIIPKTSPYVMPDVSIDLKKHHYSLGNFKEKMTTTARESNLMKEGTAQLLNSCSNAISHENLLNFSRSNHFEYGNDKAQKISTNHIDYVKKNSGNDKEEAEEIKKELQKTHFELGKVGPCFETTSANDFNFKANKVEVPRLDLAKEHYKLGTDRVMYASESQSAFSNRSQLKQNFNTEQLSDLRKSHFFFGNKESQYSLTSQDFGLIKGNATQPKVKDGVFRCTNFVLGTSNKPIISTYSSSHIFSTPNLIKSATDRKSDKKTNFTLGNEGNQLISINQQDFIPLKITPQENKNMKPEYLKKHHYQLGNEKAVFECTSQRYGAGKSNSVDKSSKILQDLRTSHFVLGSDSRDMKTMNQQEYIPRKNMTNDEQGKIIHAKYSFTNGKEKMSWNTEQKSRFGWVNPIVDANVKFSFE